MYDVLRDFAGPLATIIASSAALIFVRRQALTAETQAETALDQLRYNLFAKRFAIYEDIQQLLRLLINDAHKKEFNAFDVLPHYTVMSEASFFFSDEIVSWVKELEADCQRFLLAHASQPTNPPEYSSAQRRLIDQLRGMPERFRKELRFRQLTQTEPSCSRKTWPTFGI